MDPAASYQLVVWDNGGLTLSDLELDRHYPLDSFGRAASGAINELRRLKAEALANADKSLAEELTINKSPQKRETVDAAIGGD